MSEACTEWTESKNARRCALIDQQVAGTLSQAEQVELEQLQQALRRELQRVAPLPLEDAHALVRELLEKAQRRTEANP